MRGTEAKAGSGKLATLAIIGVLLIALVLGGLATHLPGARDEGSVSRQAAFVAMGVVATLLYFAACWLVLRGPRSRRAVWLVLGVAVVMRLAVLSGPPFLSTDLYRYVWDGRVQLAGIDVYRYIPDDPALFTLRDTAIYPYVNRHEYARTIYPPMAQLVFRAIASVWQSVTMERLTMLGFDLLAIGVMLRLLAIAGLDPARVAIYAWNPLSVWEFAGNGHVDVIAIALISLAMLFRVRGRGAWTGAVLGAAVLVKFLPVIVAPALWRPRDARRWRDWTMPAAMAAVIVALYAYYGGGLGFLSGYAAQEGLESGTGIYWLDLLDRFVTLPAGAGTIWMALGGILLLALGAWMVFVRPPPQAGDPVPVARDIAVLAALLTAIITPHYAWYFVWLALPSCLAPMPSVIFLSAAAILQYHDPYNDRVLQFSAIYLPFLALAAIDLWRRRIRRPAPVAIAARSI
jgi:alpha-1,6-mannosyltransferase